MDDPEFIEYMDNYNKNISIYVDNAIKKTKNDINNEINDKNLNIKE
jgi:hypothetical protein